MRLTQERGGVVATTTAAAGGRQSGDRRHEIDEPARLRLLECTVAVIVSTGLAWEAARNWPELPATVQALLPWLLVVAVADLAPVPIWGSVELMMSFPVLLAAGFVFPPYIAGILGFVGTMDAREFKREISPLRALLNRGNVAASVALASWVFHAFGTGVLDWPDVLAPLAVALLIDVCTNASLLILGTHLLTELAPSVVVRNVYGGSHPTAFLIGYACFGLLAVLMATVYVAAGSWALLAFAIPLLMARQMFTHWKQLGEASRTIELKERALSAIEYQMADDRRQERIALAAGIHDEVLPPLYKVHLMGQVVMQDFAAGRLLDLEADVPNLLHAVEATDSALRDMIGDLRHSTIGPGGLVETLRLLARQVETETELVVQTDFSAVGGGALTQLVAYQLAREAVGNATKHSGADRIVLSLREEEDSIRLRVSDNGCGFDPQAVDSRAHFGLQLMRERAELAGGALVVDSSPGHGTTILVRLPVTRRHNNDQAPNETWS
jgi:signal transduction histidine kinase